ncbi:hypothetical protein [Henriciella marina]|uniref:hypothetical protein n=1 Tax=Henriciella marina TaxID=453851 RepID=UPI00037C17A1|nr:hypothetical protein [Henriciella marina]
MKYTLFSVAIASLALAACGGADTDTDTPAADTEITEEAAADSSDDTTLAEEAMTMDAADLQEDCGILATDPEAQENFAEMGTDGEGFCACFVQLVEAKPDDEREQILMTLGEVTDDMQATGEGAEEAVSRLMSDAMINSESEAAQATTAGVMMIGDIIDDIGNAMEDGGSCPAS